MAYLQYYIDEKTTFAEAYKQALTVKSAEIVFRKLCRHYKLMNDFQPKRINVRLEWTSGRNCPRGGMYHIILNKDENNFGILCHELAHVLFIRKMGLCQTNHSWHNKGHWTIMKRIIRYCQKKNWFTEEISRRTTPKPPKSELTKEQIKAQEMNKTKEKIMRYQKKVLYWQKKLSKAKRSLKMRENWMKKNGNNPNPTI